MDEDIKLRIAALLDEISNLKAEEKQTDKAFILFDEVIRVTEEFNISEEELTKEIYAHYVKDVIKKD